MPATNPEAIGLPYPAFCLASANGAPMALNSAGAIPVSTENGRAVYTATVSGLVRTATGTILAIQGSNSKVIRLLEVEVFGILTASAWGAVTIFRAGAPTGGTAGFAPAVWKHDANSPAAQAAVSSYLAGASGVGTLTASMRDKRTRFGTATDPGDPFVHSMRHEPMLIRGSAEWGYAQVYGLSTHAGADFGGRLTWSESDT